MVSVLIVEIQSYPNVWMHFPMQYYVFIANAGRGHPDIGKVNHYFLKGGSMSEQKKAYGIGDWVVHIAYGVGQVKKVEIKPISGTKHLCYHVRTKDGVFWLPVDKAHDNERVRPIASLKRIQRALVTLRKAPVKMASNFQTRRKRIREVSLDGDINTDLKLVRDLNARQFKKGLNATEQDAFNSIIKRFVQEWSISKGIKLQEAHQKVDRFLQESRQKAKRKKKIAA
jgi:RNA polymerase-interacting CarD/CdnL/TRCF family regulator